MTNSSSLDIVAWLRFENQTHEASATRRLRREAADHIESLLARIDVAEAALRERYEDGSIFLASDMTPPDPARVAEKLSKTERKAWKRAEWCGEYYEPPVLSRRYRDHADKLDLLTADGEVTRLGELLIEHLRRTFIGRLLAFYLMFTALAGLAMKAVIPALNPLGVAYVGITWPVAMACVATGNTCSNVPPERYAYWLFW